MTAEYSKMLMGKDQGKFDSFKQICPWRGEYTTEFYDYACKACQDQCCIANCAIFFFLTEVPT